LQDIGLNGSVILRWIFRKRDGGDMDWVDLDKDRDRCCALVNPVITFGFYKMLCIS
jgi:hypothetical protein